MGLQVRDRRTSDGQRAWIRIVAGIDEVFERMREQDAKTNGWTFYSGMDSQAHVMLECTRVVKEQCRDEVDLDDTLKMQYLAALMMERRWEDYERQRMIKWGERVTPESMSLRGFKQNGGEQ